MTRAYFRALSKQNCHFDVKKGVNLSASTYPALPNNGSCHLPAPELNFLEVVLKGLKQGTTSGGEPATTFVSLFSLLHFSLFLLLGLASTSVAIKLSEDNGHLHGLSPCSARCSCAGHSGSLCGTSLARIKMGQRPAEFSGPHRFLILLPGNAIDRDMTRVHKGGQKGTSLTILSSPPTFRLSFGSSLHLRDAFGIWVFVGFQLLFSQCSSVSC